MFNASGLSAYGPCATWAAGTGGFDGHPAPPGGRAEAPAAYVRAADLGVDRLEQTYEHLGPGRYGYAAPAFDFACVLEYDDTGLVTRYPGIAVRCPATVGA